MDGKTSTERCVCYRTGLCHENGRISRADRDDRVRRDGDRRGSGVLGRIGDRRSYGHRDHAEVVLIITTKTSSMGAMNAVAVRIKLRVVENCVGVVVSSMYLVAERISRISGP